jgi:predicted transcriptional regulator
MNHSATTKVVPVLSLDKVGRVLNDSARWRILRELAGGEALPVYELARRVGRSTDSVSKHLLVLKNASLVVQGFGRLYRMSPGLLPQPGSLDVDLGFCVLKLGNVQ